MYPIVIVAGGKGTRLGELTRNTAKSLIDINGKPFIYHQLSLLQKSQFSDVVLCLGHFGNQVEEYVKSAGFNLNIQYSHEGFCELGTGGAIKMTLNKINSDVFFILYGDSYLPVRYKKIYDYHKNIVPDWELMTIYKNKNIRHKNNVSLKHNFVSQYSKDKNEGMEYIDFGISIFHKKWFKEIESDRFDLSTIYQNATKEKSIISYEIRKKFYEIGSIKGIEELKSLLKENDDT